MTTAIAMDTKLRIYIKPSQLAIILGLLEPIMNNPPARDDYRACVKLYTFIEETLDKIYSGHKRPEYVPVLPEERIRKPINAANMGFSARELAIGKSEVVGYNSFEDALAASDYEDNDAIMASVMGVSKEEYLAQIAKDAEEHALMLTSGMTEEDIMLAVRNGTKDEIVERLRAGGRSGEDRRNDDRRE